MAKIALITPYSGSNFGDGAIQEAVLENIWKRIPTAEVVLFSTDPYRTTLLHKLPSRMITSFEIPGYSGTIRHSFVGKGSGGQDSPAGGFGRLKNLVRRCGPLYAVLRLPLRCYKTARFGIPAVLQKVIRINRLSKSMRDFDLVLVSGGGQIDDYWGGPWGHPFTLFKWAIVCKRARVSFAILSVGVCSLESKLSRFFVKGALCCSMHCSYRDEKSRDLLNAMDIRPRGPVFPDLAFSFPEERCAGLGKKRKSDTVTVGISPIAYLSDNWPKHDLDVFNRYLEILISFTRELLQVGYRIVLFATDAPDWGVVSDMEEALRNSLPEEQAERLHRTDVDTVDSLITVFGDLDCVVASRLHGIILSQLNSVPVLAISYDRKIETHMEDVGQESFCLDIHRVQTGEIAESFGQLLEISRETIEAVGKRISERRELLNRLYDSFVSLTFDRREYQIGAERAIEKGEVECAADDSAPLVSVVTPVYNGEEFLADAIESVLAQDYTNWEYLIVNNRSDDRTLEIAEGYAKQDFRIRVLTNRYFVNAEQNHNIGFRAISSRSGYCKVVSADDRLLPDCLGKMVRFGMENPGAAIIGSYQMRGNEIRWKGLPEDISVIPGREVCRMSLLEEKHVFGNPTSSLYRADLLRQPAPFFPHSSPHADTSACLACLWRYDFGFIHEVLSEERLHEGQISTKVDELGGGTAAYLEGVVNYGPVYLSEPEYRERVRILIREYYRYLGGRALKLSGREFWELHRSNLRDLDLSLHRSRVLWHSLLEVIEEGRNPELAFRKVKLALTGKAFA